MFRYIGFFWNHQDVAARVTARYLTGKCRTLSAHELSSRSGEWTTACAGEGFEVLTTGASPAMRALPCGPGVILGRLFKAAHGSPGDEAAACEQLAPADVQAILRTRGRRLIEDYWGNYVALLPDPQTRSRWVLRGPAATLPCLSTTIGSVHVYFSWTEALARLEARAFSINWRQVARVLMGPLVSRQTGLDGVHEILPGFCEEASGSRLVEHRYWDPVRVAQTDPLEDFETAARELRAVTRSSVAAWARVTPRILHALSGGLDSSIVLGCLHRAPARPEMTCLTHFADGPDSDERPFARLAARAANCHHIERQHGGNVDLRGALYQTRLETTPGMRICEIDRIEPDIALAQRAIAIYKGHGGDELFCRHHTRFYVADYLRAHGLTRELLRLVLHSAVTEGETVWSVFVAAACTAFIPHRWDLTAIFHDDQEGISLLHPQVQRSVLEDRSLDCPVATSTRVCSPGKLWQISLVSGRRLHYLPSMRDGDPENVAPLLSQPVIELCLRIRTWLQMKGRRERAVARAAFVQEVPRETLERRWKGGAEHTAWQLLHENLPFVRELLLDGLLARERIVERHRLESLLSSSPASVLHATVPMFDLIGAEAWLQAWSGRGVRIAS